MRHIRAIIYRLGFRPKCGSIWHSPTLHWQYAFNSFGADFEKAVREELARLRKRMRHHDSHTPGCRPTERHAIVVTYYRGNYTLYERDVRLATAVRDKYWP